MAQGNPTTYCHTCGENTPGAVNRCPMCGGNHLVTRQTQMPTTTMGKEDNG